MRKYLFFICVILFASACTKETEVPSITLSSINTLADLEVNGTTVSGFNPYVNEYNYKIVPNEKFPVVDAIPSDSRALVNIFSPPSVPGTVTIQVTPENGYSTNFYYINFGYEFEDTILNIPGEDIFYDFNVDKFNKLTFEDQNGQIYNDAIIANGVLEVLASDFIFIHFTIPHKSADYSKIYVEVTSNSAFESYISINDNFSFVNPLTYYQFNKNTVVDLKTKFNTFSEEIDIQLIVRESYITHLRISGDK